MTPIAFEESLSGNALFPFTLTRRAQELRLGILTIREKWEHIRRLLPASIALPVISPLLLPDVKLVGLVREHQTLPDFSGLAYLQYPWQIVQQNRGQLLLDFELITFGRASGPISPSNHVVDAGQVFLEAGAQVECCVLNASDGPIYIGRDAHIMEGCLIRGPVAVGAGSVLKMGTKIYGATTIGPGCVMGGEIKNSVIFGNSNKAHDGYLGDAVIGEWCNLGAGTSNSNIKNNASVVKVWDESVRQFRPAAQKCGLLMGDYCRSAINTSFNTGTLTGVCCNIFGNGMPPKYMPSFSWGFAKERYDFTKAMEDIRNWKKLKNQPLREDEIQTLKHIFDQT